MFHSRQDAKMQSRNLAFVQKQRILLACDTSLIEPPDTGRLCLSALSRLLPASIQLDRSSGPFDGCH